LKPLDLEPTEQTETKRKPLRVLGALRGVVQVVLAVVILFGAYTAMQKMIAGKPEVPQRPARERVYTIKTVGVEITDHQPMLRVYGQVVAGRLVDLRVLVSGQVVSIHPRLKAGATIAQGETLIKIDPFSYRGAVTEAKASLAEAHAKLSESEARKAMETDALARAQEQLELAKRDLKRAEDLSKRGSIAERNIDDRRLIVSQRGHAVEQRRNNLKIEKARTEQLRTQVDRQGWRLEQAQRHLADTVLKSPFAGVVVAENVENGRLLNANDLAVRMYDKDLLEVRFTLSDQQYGRMVADTDPVAGREAKVIWHVGDVPVEFAAHIDRAGAEITAARGGVELYARIDGDEALSKLRPGAFVELQVPGSKFRKSIRLPETAVYSSDKGSFVYAVVKGRLEGRPVTIKSYMDGDVIVRGELAEAERVLATRIAEVGTGLKVREERVEKKSQTGLGITGTSGAKKSVKNGRGS